MESSTRRFRLLNLPECILYTVQQAILYTVHCTVGYTVSYQAIKVFSSDFYEKYQLFLRASVDKILWNCEVLSMKNNYFWIIYFFKTVLQTFTILIFFKQIRWNFVSYINSLLKYKCLEFLKFLTVRLTVYYKFGPLHNFLH